jgi:hypothetical protein
VAGCRRELCWGWSRGLGESWDRGATWADLGAPRAGLDAQASATEFYTFLHGLNGISPGGGYYSGFVPDAGRGGLSGD